MFRALLHFLVLAAVASPAGAQVYKWVDERGVTHYGERPPQGRKASEVPHRLGTPPAPGMAKESPPSNPSSQQPDLPPNPVAPRSQSQAQPQAQTAPLSSREREALRLKEQCSLQRDLLARLKQNPQLDDSGAIAKQEKNVADLCKN